ncbi:MAG: hypothetical protein HC915_21240 [Anaerolineae bacterium]|nr:hypothetical protein [Anaerolineae bacterium]
MNISLLFSLLTLAVLAFSGSVLAWRLVLLLRTGAGWDNLARLGQHLRQVASLLGWVVFSLLVSLLLAEIGLRVYLDRYGSETERIRYLYDAETIRRRDSRFVGQPYINYMLNPDHPEINSRGFRGPEIELPKPPGRYRIVALGGSTTYGFDLPTWELTFPGQLQRILREDYGYTNVDVINGGADLYTTWESLVNLQFRVLELEPDLIIIYHGVNDTTARLVPPETYSGLGNGRGIWLTGDAPLPASTLWRFVGLQLGALDDPAALEARFEFAGGVPSCGLWTRDTCHDYPTAELLTRNPPIYFEQNLRSMVAIAQAHGLDVLLSAWAYYPIETGTPNIYAQAWRQAAATEQNALVADLAETLQTGFVDLMGLLPVQRDLWHHDGYHQSIRGAELQAQHYAAAIVAEGWLLDHMAEGLAP